ncbi:TetR family transcriptional regulator [Pseudomonas alcaligenes]|uniref:TetR family transcriptional regulator n=1 Tax=Aquipseudomonas alcaligenes TaxID=43263 RepID=A0ABR7S1W3_AQUAC|nr:TetR family transcriptional regulator [Pseudomonas alcaligenes]
MTRTQRRAADMRRNLIEIAETLLIEGGAAAVTADEVARRADVSLQTVYNRVGGKPALLIAIAERSMEENRAYVDKAYEGKGTPEERGLRIFNAYVNFAFDRPHQFRILANPPEEPEAISRIGAMAQEQIAHLTSIIRGGIASEWASPDIDPESATNAVWAMMNGLLSLALRDDALRSETISRESLVQAAITVIQLGLRNRQS